MLSYVIIGSGYRAEYFGRIAASHPSLFRAMFLCRSEEKAPAKPASLSNRILSSSPWIGRMWRMWRRNGWITR